MNHKAAPSGLNPAWTAKWRAEVRKSNRWYETYLPVAVADLEGYADGKDWDFGSANSIAPKMTRRSWEGPLKSDLDLYAVLKLRDLEVRAMDGGAFDRDAALQAFAAGYTAEMLFMHAYTAYKRACGMAMTHMGWSRLPFSALGVVIGCTDQAFRLARLQLARYRHEPSYEQGFPIYHFLFALLNDYLDEPPLPSRGGTAHTLHGQLLANWRSADPAALIPLFQEACDFHTWRCASGSGDEFDQGDWTHIPIEILLLFKLRILAGLANPRLAHPIMATSLGELPDEVAFVPEPLLARVLDRMHRDGYDEKQIFTECYAGVRK